MLNALSLILYSLWQFNVTGSLIRKSAGLLSGGSRVQSMRDQHSGLNNWEESAAFVIWYLQTGHSSLVRWGRKTVGRGTFTYLVLAGRKRTHTAIRKEKKIQTPVVWSTFPWLGGLSVRSDFMILLQVTYWLPVNRVYMYVYICLISLKRGH